MADISNLTFGCDAVNTHIATPIPHTLWHYTSFEGFKGIVTSKKIWASEYRFLNDQEEFLHAKKLAQELLLEEPEFSGQRFPARDMLSKAVNIAFNTGFLHENRLKLMVASFSEAADQLSQWRGYSGNSTGISLGLDLRGIRPPSDIGTAVTFAPCLYEEAEKRTLVKAVFAHFRLGIQTWWDSFADQFRQEHAGQILDADMIWQFIQSQSHHQRKVLDAFHASLRFDLLRVAPLIKNKSFSEEKEWRLVLPRENILLPSLHTIEFRATRNGIVPYIAFPLLLPNQDGPIACTNVFVGPGSHPSAVVGVNLFLQSQQIPIPANPSSIPYRPE